MRVRDCERDRCCWAMQRAPAESYRDRFNAYARTLLDRCAERARVCVCAGASTVKCALTMLLPQNRQLVDVGLDAERWCGCGGVVFARVNWSSCELLWLTVESNIDGGEVAQMTASIIRTQTKMYERKPTIRTCKIGPFSSGPKCLWMELQMRY